MGSNLIFVIFLIGSIVKWIAICSLDSAIRIKISVEEGILKTSASTFMENLQKTKYLKNKLQTVRCFRWLVSFLHITSKSADDIVENNNQVILAGFETGTFWMIETHDNDNNKKSLKDQVKMFSIMLNWSITKKWKFVELKFTYRKTVWS